jgi:hypothetical protein
MVCEAGMIVIYGITLLFESLDGSKPGINAPTGVRSERDAVVFVAVSVCLTVAVFLCNLFGSYTVIKTMRTGFEAAKRRCSAALSKTSKTSIGSHPAVPDGHASLEDTGNFGTSGSP